MIVQQELLSNSYKWNSYKYNFIKIQPFSFMTGLGSWTLILGTHSSAEGSGGGGKAVLFLSCSFFFLSLFYLLILFLQLPLRPRLKTCHLLITFISREMREDTTGVQCKAWPLFLYRCSASHHVHSLRTGRRLLLASFHVMGILGSLRKQASAPKWQTEYFWFSSWQESSSWLLYCLCLDMNPDCLTAPALNKAPFSSQSSVFTCEPNHISFLCYPSLPYV